MRFLKGPKKLNIQAKFLLVLSLVLSMSIAMYTLLTIALVKEEKVALLYDMNHGVVVNMAQQIRVGLQSIVEQMKPYVLSRLDGSSMRALVGNQLEQSHVSSLSVFRVSRRGGFTPILLQNGFPEVKLNRQVYEAFLHSAYNSGLRIWAEDDDKKLRHFYLAARIDIITENGNQAYVTVAEVGSAFFLSSFQVLNLFKGFLVDHRGNIMLAADGENWIPAPVYLGHPLLQKIRHSALPSSGVEEFKFAGKSWYGAFSKVGVSDLTVISQADHSNIDSAVSIALRQALKIGLGVVLMAIVISVLFARNLTQNILRVAEAAKLIGQGKMDTLVNVSSHDELEDLAKALNWMTVEIHKSRETIETQNRDLEKKVLERTAELKKKNVAIREVQDALVKTTQLAAAGEVAGRTAHEVLNPLTGILTRAEKAERSSRMSESLSFPNQIASIVTAWAKDFKEGGPQRLLENLQKPSTVKDGATLLEEDIGNLQELVDMWKKSDHLRADDFRFIHERGTKIHRIINEMRKLVRSGVQKDEVHAHASIKEMVSVMEDFLQKEGVGVEVKLEAQEDLVLVNRDEFAQILANLMRNAVQSISSQKGEVSQPGLLSIATSNTGDAVCITIVDNGPGVPADKQTSLFQSGFTTKNIEQGTGLGLAICRRYARSFGGDVDFLFSEPKGRGTCFQITLPKSGKALQLAA